MRNSWKRGEYMRGCLKHRYTSRNNSIQFSEAEYSLFGIIRKVCKPPARSLLNSCFFGLILYHTAQVDSFLHAINMISNLEEYRADLQKSVEHTRDSVRKKREERGYFESKILID